MGKIRYQFNTKSLAVEPVKETFKDKFKKFLRVVMAGMVFSAVVLILGYSLFESPKEKMLLREVDQYKTQYRILHDRVDVLASVLEDIEHRD
ncbi:MAG: hypothetical protein R6U11_02805 [Bacteroidales bacterium]